MDQKRVEWRQTGGGEGRGEALRFYLSTNLIVLSYIREFTIPFSAAFHLTRKHKVTQTSVIFHAAFSCPNKLFVNRLDDLFLKHSTTVQLI